MSSIYENGLAHGEASWWGRDGRLLATTTNVHGTGTAYQFDDQDRMTATLEFKNGQFVSKIMHDPARGASEAAVKNGLTPGPKDPKVGDH